MRKDSAVRMTLAAVIVVVLSAAGSAFGACGDTIPTPSGGQMSPPAVVSWDDSVDQAILVATIKKKPFGIYFAAKDEAGIIGENVAVLKEYMKNNNNTLPVTAMDVPRVVSQVRELGIGNFVKVKVNKENRALMEKYGGEVNTLIVCAPNGDRITAFKCTADVAKQIDGAKKELTTWQQGK